MATATSLGQAPHWFINSDPRQHGVGTYDARREREEPEKEIGRSRVREREKERQTERSHSMKGFIDLVRPGRRIFAVTGNKCTSYSAYLSISLRSCLETEVADDVGSLIDSAAVYVKR